MATHDYVIANASGAAVRADLNNALAAIVTNNSNATEPATTYPYMLWADTTAGQLKLRNGTNDAWIVLQELDGTLLMEDGTVAAPGLAFASDIDTGFYRPAADQIAVATNGVERVKYGTTEVVFNDGAEDYDFRIEGSTQPSLIATNAGDDTISFGGNITSDTVYDGDVQMASQNGGQLAGFRNQLINGGFQINQRGTTFASGRTGDYTSDRWLTGTNIAVSVFTDTNFLPAGFTNAVEINPGAANAFIDQRIEMPNGGFWASPSSTWTLSAWVDKPNNFELNLDYRDNANAVLASFTKVGSLVTGEVNGIYTRVSQTFTAPAYTAGTIYSQANLANLTAGETTRLTGVQLEPGPVATPFEHRPIGTELALCQRYFFAHKDTFTQSAYQTGGSTYRVPYFYPVEMRTAPTISPTPSSSANMAPGTWAQVNTQTATQEASTSTTGAVSLTVNANTEFDAEL